MPIPLFGKIALVVLAVLVMRWLASIPRKIESDLLFQQGLQFERECEGESAIRNYEQALARSPDNTSIALRLLAVYNAALQVNNARDLIQRLNGRIFQENEIEELEATISRYRRVNFEKNARGCVVRLTD
jgi:thioredoxin-like negative regulator of GroEL